MAVDKFFYILVVVVFAISFISTDTNTDKKSKTKNPLIVAEKFSLHRHYSDQAADIISGDNYAKYTDYELYRAIFIDVKQNNKSTKITAAYMKKVKNILTLDGDIVFENDEIKFETSKLSYNTKTAIAKTTQKYTANYGGLYISGDELYVDLSTNSIKSNHIMIEQRN